MCQHDPGVPESTTPRWSPLTRSAWSPSTRASTRVEAFADHQQPGPRRAHHDAPAGRLCHVCRLRAAARRQHDAAHVGLGRQRFAPRVDAEARRRAQRLEHARGVGKPAERLDHPAGADPAPHFEQAHERRAGDLREAHLVADVGRGRRDADGARAVAVGKPGLHQPQGRRARRRAEAQRAHRMARRAAATARYWLPVTPSPVVKVASTFGRAWRTRPRTSGRPSPFSRPRPARPGARSRARRRAAAHLAT